MKTFNKALILFYLLLIFLLPQIAKAQLSLDLDPLSPCSADDSDTDDDGFIDICDIEGLYSIRDGLDDKYELRQSLDFHNDGFIYYWPPIYLFNGEFNGNGHTISNLQIDPDEDIEISDENIEISANDVGLFGQIGNEAKISNVGLLNIDIVGGGQRVGGLAAATAGILAIVMLSIPMRIGLKQRDMSAVWWAKTQVQLLIAIRLLRCAGTYMSVV